MARPPIVLTGMMLSGKSTVGRLLADRLGCPFVDLDAAIETQTGRTIPEWFALGEPAFRRAEREALARQLVVDGPRVIAAGGGAMEDVGSRRRCRDAAFVVYLEAPATVLARRMSSADGRPLLEAADDPEATLVALLDRREANYLAAQHTRIDVANRTADDVVDAVIVAYDAFTDG